MATTATMTGMCEKPRYPFVPDMSRCRMTMETHGATVYIMDDCCRNFTLRDKAAADRVILDLARAAERRRRQRAAEVIP